MKGAVNVIPKEKIALQISYASTQWQVSSNIVKNTKAYTPSYSQVVTRLNTAGTTTYFDEISQNPYAVYSANNVKNVIWYENNRSVTAKLDLAKLLGIQGVSYWRLGNMPN